jgi:hypothetical protein
MITKKPLPTLCDHLYDGELLTPHEVVETPKYEVMVLRSEAARDALFVFTCVKCGHSYTGSF